MKQPTGPTRHLGWIRFGAALVLVLLAALTLGCGRTLRTAEVARVIEHQLPECRFERTAHVAVGPLVMSLARRIASWSGDLDSDARTILKSIRRAEVATYRIVGSPDRDALARLLRLRQQLERSGWEMAVTEVDGDDITVVLLRLGPNETVRGLMAVQFDHDELEIACVEGRLDRVLAEQLGSEPSALAAALNDS